MIHLPNQGWKLLLRGYSTTTVRLTEASFAEAMQELLKG